MPAEGRVATIRYPDTVAPASGSALVQSRPADLNEFKVQNHYQRGTLTKVTGPGGAAPAYWELTETTAWGGARKATLGNGIESEVTFDVAKQLPTLIQAKLSGALLVDQGYLWNQAGNLIRRVDNLAGHGEDFVYDAQHRLKQVVLDDGFPTGPITYTNEYDKVGKLTKRYASAGAAVAVTDYAYGATQPHAVDSVKFGGVTQTYGHDLNGNATTARGLPVSWTAFNMPYEIGNTGGAAWSRFVYGPDRSRWKQTIQSPGFGQGTTYYIGSLFEREERGIAQIFRYTVFAGGQAVAYHKSNGTTGQTSYLHRDHLGSVVAITDASGAIRERYSFDPWGKRRSASTWDSESAGSFLASTGLSNSEGYRRGFTGHEMLDHLGLVHMNGRVYDPEIGRFLSADPFVQFPESTQGYDRYQYVHNNPLSATDPSGHFITAIYAIAVMAAKVEGVQLVAASVVGAVVGYIETGSVKGGLLTGVSIYAGGELGAEWRAEKISFGKFAVDSVVLGGALSEAGGGRFGDGALGAAGGLAVGNSGLGDLVQSNVFVAAIVGGSLSELGGGRFANGAIGGMFAFAVSGGLGKASTADCADGGCGVSDETLMTITANQEWRDKGLIRVEDDRLVIDLAVSGPYADAYAERAMAAWNGRSGMFAGRSVTLDVRLRPKGDGGDWRIEWGTRRMFEDAARRKMRLGCQASPDAIPAMQSRYGGSVTYLNPNYRGGAIGLIKAAEHEFGHGLGFSHAPDSTGNIMSYAQARMVQSVNVAMLAGEYR